MAEEAVPCERATVPATSAPHPSLNHSQPKSCRDRYLRVCSQKSHSKTPHVPTLGTVTVPKTPSGAQGLPQPPFSLELSLLRERSERPEHPGVPL